MSDFQQITEGLDELPTLPVVVSRVLQAVEDKQSSAKDLVDIIQNDQAIAAKVLRVANSAYYGLPNKVNTISHAIVLLGFETVRNLCLGVGVFRSFLPYRLHESVNLEKFWEHTIASAVCSRILRPDKSQEESEETFLAALIHDIGRLCFLAAQPDLYLKVILNAKKEGKPLIEIEQNVFGGTHAELGGLLCKHWNFGKELIQPVVHHHDPENAEPEYAERAAEVAVSNCIAQQRGMRWRVDTVIPEVPQFAMDVLELTPEDVTQLGDRLEGRRSMIESFTMALM